MDLAELQRRIDRYAQLDLAPLYDAYKAQGGGDIDGFLAFLGTARVVDAALLKELHGLGDVEIPTVRDPAFAGTMLAAWTAGTVLAPTGESSAVDAKTNPAAAANKPGTIHVQSSATVPGSTEGDAGATGAAAPAQDARFTPITKLGEGAMGAVHIARDLYLRRKVALKSVLPEMAAHPELLTRFLAEMQITAQLEHPNIVPVYALEVMADGSLGYAMKLVQGRDFDQLLDEARARMEKGEPLDGDLTVEKRVEYFLKVCDAVEYAHSKGIVHRDLKPANIMIGRHNEVYLMDWGIARPMGAGGQSVEQGIELQVGDQPSNDLSRTRVGSAIGTPFYMSPEQAEGKNRDLDGRSDQYTMGLILQECVSLKRAVGGTTLQEVLTKAKEARRDPVMIGQSLGHVPPEVEAIVRKATRLDPKDRYPSVAALADDVRRFARGEAVLALPEGPVRRAGRWLAKHRMAALTLILGLGLVGAGGTIGALVIGQQRIEAEHARELRVSQLQTESAIQAQVVDRELSRYEEALAELVGATQAVLSRPPPPDAATYLDDAFTGKAPPAPGLAASKRYGKDVSVQAGVTSLAAGVTRDAAESALAQLASLTPELRALFLGSAGADWQRMSPAAQRAAITDAGVPAFRAAITLDQGVTLRFPGMAGQPTTDDRGSEWYRAAKGTRGVKWGQPVQGEKGALLPATEALYDERGTFRGVVTLEVSLERLLDRPESVALDFVESKQLIGRDGKLMAEDNAAGGERAPMAPEVLAAIAKGQSGGLVADVGGKKWQYAYYPLATLDWYYVAAGRVQRMMASKARVTTSDPRKLVAAAAPAPAVATVAPSATPTSPDVPDAGADAGDDAGPDGGDDAGAADAGIADAGAHDAGVLRDGGLPAYRKPGPMPKATAKPEVEANPFEPWKAYEKK